MIRNLAQGLGLNVMFDDSFKENEKFLVSLRDVTLGKALDLILIQNKLIFEQLDRRTILVYQDNPQIRRRPERMLVKTFYLGNADLNETRALVQSLLTSGGGTQIHALDGQQNQTKVGESVQVSIGTNYIPGFNAVPSPTGGLTTIPQIGAGGGAFDSVQYRDMGLVIIVITVTPHIVRSTALSQEDHLARQGGAPQSGLTRSVEEVVLRAQLEDERDHRLSASARPLTVNNR